MVRRYDTDVRQKNQDSGIRIQGWASHKLSVAEASGLIPQALPSPDSRFLMSDTS